MHAAYSSRIYRQLDVSLTPLRVKLLEEKCAELHRWGFLERPLDVRTLVDPEPLRQAQVLWRERKR